MKDHRYYHWDDEYCCAANGINDFGSTPLFAATAAAITLAWAKLTLSISASCNLLHFARRFCKEEKKLIKYFDLRIISL